MKKLFKVHISTYVIIESEESDNDIRWQACQAMRSHISDVRDTSDISYEELKSLQELPPPWTHNCLPYNTTAYYEDKTIGEILGDKCKQ